MGLAHAHTTGLVHRDVSPANILLDREGVSKLVDFGLDAATNEGVTPGTATSVGTPAFTSPEAVMGQPMTTRSDVYSAAAVLYLLLSGRLPHSGDAAALLQGHVSAPVPKLDGHGRQLADLLGRAMAKSPAARPADAAAFLGEREDAAVQRYGAGWLDRHDCRRAGPGYRRPDGCPDPREAHGGGNHRIGRGHRCHRDHGRADQRRGLPAAAGRRGRQRRIHRRSTQYHHRTSADDNGRAAVLRDRLRRAR